MDAAVSSRSVMAALYGALEGLCNGSWSAVRVACVLNGAENRFLVRIEPEWRTAVYTHLAQHSDIRIPPDGGPLNLSAEEAVRLGAMTAHAPAASADRPARRLSSDVRGDTLRHTFQP
jgi:hypothetical protein